jgi:DNA (cytosine-5)-methyltransferase 1
MNYLSVCSGIEAATVAWHPIGWHPVAFAEVESFPSAVLAHHYPEVPNRGDITKFREWHETTIDLLVGGTPCQSFSVAGLRKGLDDPRGSLMLTYLAIALRYRPRWVVWENVPGVLSADDGRALGSLLGGLAELGYGFAYRVLDAQYFGLAQRRARVFVVGHLGDWRRPAAVLFERESLSGHPAPRREAGERASPTLTTRTTGGGGLGTDHDINGGLIHCEEVSRALTACHTATGRLDPNEMEFIAHSLRADGFDASEDGTGRGTPIVPTIAPCLTQNYGKQPDNSDTAAGPMLVAFSVKDHGADAGELAPTLRAGTHDKSHANGGVMPAIAFQESQSGFRATDAHPTLDSHNGSRRHHGALVGMQVRRLTPRECERLQGFPDDYTLIPYRGKPAKDGPRYKALGNFNGRAGDAVDRGADSDGGQLGP